jgi:hypothetical protein
MKKIRLDADDLQVLSFATAQMPGVRGTAKAAETGYPCYDTIGYYQTVCEAYAPSHWNEDTCYCTPVPVTPDHGCAIDTADLTCHTCPGQPGC